MFRTKPFPLFNTIGDLVDGTRATGQGVFRAGQTSTFDPPNSPACDNSPDSIDSKIDPVLLEASQTMGKAKEKALDHVRTVQV